ncbi:ABC transporter substrate-binding protein [Bacillus sp. FJAT-49732]|uniref:ABC transporter substrate-binding protein n=1 Tax=Lederbergia citrisecunda TaxID=2833583 RepID=A0A942TPU9_9BACI|nr:ABC transporter substrate-binding protein [Lederbergia citrisecunda]MBS4201203.1 ABC transporter substrate-binding protein [Lederbergia citrisecunda]
MKKLSLLLLVMMVSVFVAACGNSTKEGDTSNSKAAETEKAPAEPVEVVFWHAMSDTHEKWLEDATAKFNAEHDNITVKLVNQGSYGDLSQKLLAAAKAKASPTIAQAYAEWMTDYNQNNLLVDLAPMIKGENGFPADQSYEDISEVFRNDNTFGDKILGLPFNKSSRVLFYNKKYFEDNGLTPPTTWEELAADAKALTKEIDGKKVVGMGFENGMGSEFSMWVEQAGGEFVDEQQGKVLFNTDAGLDALTFINNMIKDGSARMAGEDGYMSGPFTRGDVAMYIGSSAGIAYVAKDAGDMQWSTTPLPKGAKQAAPFQGTNITMFANSTEAQQAAAFEYMKYLITPENTVDWAKTTGYLPVRTSAQQGSDWTSFIAENEPYQAGNTQYAYGFIDVRLPGSFAMKNAMQAELDKMLYENATPAEALEAMTIKAQEALDQAK